MFLMSLCLFGEKWILESMFSKVRVSSLHGFDRVYEVITFNRNYKGKMANGDHSKHQSHVRLCVK